MLKITRYPETKNNSLQVSSAADDLLLRYIEEQQIPKGKLLLANDRFGYLACHLHDRAPYSVISFKSQEKALRMNLSNNNLPWDEKLLIKPLEEIPESIDVALIKIPKSLELFRLQLHQIHQASQENTIVLCGFMTKYFSKQMLKIAHEFFEEITQSLAWKKSRLIILKSPKPKKEIQLIKSFQWQDLALKQYLGVFSADKVDYATQFLLDHISLNENEQRVLDLASGNGVIAAGILQQSQKKNRVIPELHLLDDFYLAVESSKLNLPLENSHFHFDDDLENLNEESFDLVVSNPPFHFDYEINTEITMNFFEQVYTILKPDARFVLVFNRHLRYTTLLKRIYSRVEVMADSPKFMVMECWK